MHWPIAAGHWFGLWEPLDSLWWLRSQYLSSRPLSALPQLRPSILSPSLCTAPSTSRLVKQWFSKILSLRPCMRGPYLSFGSQGATGHCYLMWWPLWAHWQLLPAWAADRSELLGKNWSSAKEICLLKDIKSGILPYRGVMSKFKSYFIDDCVFFGILCLLAL